LNPLRRRRLEVTGSNERARNSKKESADPAAGLGALIVEMTETENANRRIFRYIIAAGNLLFVLWILRNAMN